jgi:hypothetical protein
MQCLCVLQLEQGARVLESQEADRRLRLADKVSSERLRKLRAIEMEWEHKEKVRWQALAQHYVPLLGEPAAYARDRGLLVVLIVHQPECWCSCVLAQELETLKKDRALLEHSVRESTRMITASMTLMGELQLELSGAQGTSGPNSHAAIKQQVWYHAPSTLQRVVAAGGVTFQRALTVGDVT